MRFAHAQLTLAAALLLVCIGLAAAAIDAGQHLAAVVALIACAVSFYLVLRADDAVQDALDLQALDEFEGQFME